MSIQHISAKDGFSQEELRFNDYKAGNKCPAPDFSKPLPTPLSTSQQPAPGVVPAVLDGEGFAAFDGAMAAEAVKLALSLLDAASRAGDETKEEEGAKEGKSGAASVETFTSLLAKSFDGLISASPTSGEPSLGPATFQGSLKKPTYASTDPFVLYGPLRSELAVSVQSRGPGLSRSAELGPPPPTLAELGSPLPPLASPDDLGDASPAGSPRNAAAARRAGTPLLRADSSWSASTTTRGGRDESFSVPHSSEARGELDALIASFCDVTHTSPDLAALLLIHHHWDYRTAIDKYIEDPQVALETLGVVPEGVVPFFRLDLARPFLPPGVAAATPAQNEGGDAESQSHLRCALCMESCPADRMFAAGCYHFYCAECWAGYLQSKISGGQCLIRCPFTSTTVNAAGGGHGPDNLCTECVPISMVEYLCPDGASALHENVLRHFLEDKAGPKRVTVCKNSKGCEGITMLSEDTASQRVVCGVCSFAFCSQCDSVPHMPATCSMVQQWRQRDGMLETSSEADEASAKYILATR